MARRTDDFTNPESPLYFESKGGVSRVYFNLPEKLNPFDLELSERFAGLVEVLKKEPTGVVVLTGQGRAFSAGADLDFLLRCTELPEAKVRQILKRLYSNFLKVRELPQVTVARVNGAVAGGGLGLVWACDLRTVLATARFAFNFVRIGLSPGMGLVQLTARILGEARARDLWLTGRHVRGEDIARWGGASEVGETQQMLDMVTDILTAELLANSRFGMQAIKAEFLWKDSLGPYLDFNCRYQAKALKSPEAREGLLAIREKRKPDFAAARLAAPTPKAQRRLRPKKA